MNDDWWEKHLREKKRIGIKLGWFSNESKVLCPYCGEILQDYWEYLPNEMESWGTAECDKCEKTFRLKQDIVYSTEVMERKDD